MIENKPNLLNWILWVLFFHSLPLTSWGQIKYSTVFKHDSLFLENHLFNNHVSSIKALGKDTFLCTWFGGMREGSIDNQILLSKSYDNGESWTEPQVIFNPARDTSARDPLLTIVDSTLILVFLKQIGDGNSYNAADAQLYYSKSHDYGQNWIAPIQIPFPNLRPVPPKDQPILIDSLILFGFHWRIEGQGTQTYTGILVTNKNFDNWSIRGDISVPSQRFIEPSLISRKDTLFLYFRTDQKFTYYSYSTDEGFNWSEPKITYLYNPDSKTSITSITNDTFLAVWNNHTEKRDYLNAGLFTGTNLTYWKGKTLIDVIPSQTGQVSYPSVEINDSTIHITYTKRTDTINADGQIIRFGDIIHVSFPFSELLKDENTYLSVKKRELTAGKIIKDLAICNDRVGICGAKGYLAISDTSFLNVREITTANKVYDFLSVGFDNICDTIFSVGVFGSFAKISFDGNYSFEQNIAGGGAFNDLYLGSSLFLACNSKGNITYSYNPEVGFEKHEFDSKEFHTLILEDSIQNSFLIGGDSLSLLRYSLPEGSLSEILFPQTWKSFIEIQKLNGQIFLLGQKGNVYSYLNNSITSISLSHNAEKFNFLDVIALNDSLILFITDQEKLWMYNLLTENSVEVVLPYTAQIVKGIHLGDQIKLFSVDGVMYELEINSLIDYFANENGITNNLHEINRRAREDILIYPNPSDGQINVKFNTANTPSAFYIFSIDGRVLKKGNLSLNAGERVINLDVSGLSPGFFYLSLFWKDSKKTVFPFIKL